MAVLKKTGAARETRDQPTVTREAPVNNVDASKRTVSFAWSTGAKVKRFDWYNERYYLEELSLDPAHVRMGRLQSGAAPLLNSHYGYSLEDVLGVITEAELGEGEATASARFSARESVQPVMQDVADGILKNVSVGYNIYRMERIAPAAEGDLWTYRAIDWEPMEVSIVAIGADAAAGIRGEQSMTPDGQKLRTHSCEFVTRGAAASTPAAHPPAAAGNTTEEPKMTEEEKRAAEAAEKKRKEDEALARKQAADQARVAERERLNGIREAVVTLGGLDEAFARSLSDNADMTPADAGLAVLREKAKRSAADPTRAPRVTGGRDEVDTRRGAITSAIVLRLVPGARLKPEEIETAREYRHMSLIRMAEEVLGAAGINVRGLSGMEIAGRALHSTSDFPGILANVLNKRLRLAYEESTGSYRAWARRAPNAPDFKQIQVTQLGAAPDLLPIGEAGEFKYGTIAEGKEVYQVATYGRVVALSRQTLINDDLRAFDRLVSAFGNSAARLENRIVYGILTGNANMGDGQPLFHASHGNLAASGSPISVASLSAGRSAMRVQKGLQSEELNVTPRYLLVPTALEQIAYQYTSSNFVPAKASDVNEFRSGGRTALEPIVEPVLDAVSASAWYLASDNNSIDTVEYCFLDGSEGVYTENEIGFDIDGMKVKARLDFAAKAIDHRGFYKNQG